MYADMGLEEIAGRLPEAGAVPDLRGSFEVIEFGFLSARLLDYRPRSVSPLRPCSALCRNQMESRMQQIHQTYTHSNVYLEQ